MSSARLQPTPTQPRPLSPALAMLPLVAVALGLAAPLLLGSFSAAEAAVLAGFEALCLFVAALGAAAVVRRLRSGQEALRAIAMRDELSGVGNYRALHERIGEEIARHRRHRREFVVILIDLDGFKEVNERHGHLAGDQLLAEIGAALTDEIRREDSVFRQGGDEFAVVVPETNAEEADELSARLRYRIANRGFGNDSRLPVAATTGFATYPADGTTERALLACADRHLFAAKPGAR